MTTLQGTALVPQPDKCWIYHITHIDNLPSIVSAGLVCDAACAALSSVPRSIAYASLKQRRARKQVPGLGGTLADYVPFYFCTRSPMLAAIYSQNVASYADGQDPIVYLVSTVQKAIDGGSVWSFTDGHAIEAMTHFYHDVSDLGHIDWPLIMNWSWRNVPNDMDRKRRKQAEFLVRHTVPWDMFSGVAVRNEDVMSRVAAVFASVDPARRRQIAIRPKWYYD